MPEQNQNEEILKQLKELRKEVETLKGEIKARKGEEKVRGPESRTAFGFGAGPLPPPPLAGVSEQAPYIPIEEPPPPPIYKGEESPGLIKEMRGLAEGVTGIKVPSGFHFEELAGGNWLVKIGVAAIVIGVGFFLKYAFDHWIGPAGQVATGLIVGMVLVGLGEYWKSRYRLYAQALTGGGIAILYLSIFAAYNFHDLISMYPAFFFLALITVVAGALSVRYDSPVIAFLGIIGGFLTPFMLGVKSVEENEKALLAYIILLNLGILGVSLYKNWRSLSFVGFLLTYLSFGVWFADRFTDERLAFTESALTCFFLLFAFITIIYHLINKKRASWPDLALMTMNAAIYFFWSYGLLQRDYGEWMGFFAVALSLFYFLLAYLAYFRNREDSYLTLFLAGISLVFLTIAVPIQLKQHWITIAWAVEAIVLSWLGFYLRSYHLRAFSLLVFLLVIFRLFGFDMRLDIRGLEDFVPIFNKRFFVFFVSIVSFYLASYIWYLGKDELRPEEQKYVMPALLLSANFITVWILSYEILKYFDGKITGLRKPEEVSIYDYERCAGAGGYRCYEIDVDYTAIRNLKFFQNLSLSLFWVIYAMILSMAGHIKRYAPIKLAGLVFLWLVIVKVLIFDIISMGGLTLAQNFLISFIWAIMGIVIVGLGIFSKFPPLRVTGLALLWVMVFKVFLFDTWKLAELYRVGAYISLGVILLITGYLYLRFQERIKEFLLE